MGKVRKTNRLEAERQKQMILLYNKYKRTIKTPNSWILPYSWTVAYIQLDDPKQELHHQEFFCTTNNLIFAAMIFEAQMLPVKLSIANMQFNSLVKL